MPRGADAVAQCLSREEGRNTGRVRSFGRSVADTALACVLDQGPKLLYMPRAAPISAWAKRSAHIATVIHFAMRPSRSAGAVPKNQLMNSGFVPDLDPTTAIGFVAIYELESA